MGILDTVIGSLLGGSSSNVSGMSSVLSNLLSGGQTSAAGGGLGNIISQFEQAGLGNVAQSWVGSGANQPVSTQQLQTVFGDRIPGMASQAGMSQSDFLSQLSQHLPNAVNGMTPNGQIPGDQSISV